MEVFEIKKQSVERELSTASSRIGRNSKAGYILTMAGIVLFTSALLIVLHFTREYVNLSQKISSLNSRKAEKYERRSCETPFCNTEECVYIAATLLESINLEADPCTDFYEYACGGFMRSKIVPYASNSYTKVNEAKDTLLIDIRKMMDKSSSANEGIAFTKMQTFYQSCMNQSRRSELENRTLSFWFNDNGIVADDFVLSNTIDFERPLQWPKLMSRLEEYQIHTLFKPNFVGEGNSAPEKMEIDCLVPFLNPEAYRNTSDDELAFQLIGYKESMNEALELLHFDRDAKEEFIEDVMKIERDIARTVSIDDPSPYPFLTEEHKQQLRDIWRSVVGSAVEDMEVVSTCKYDLESILVILNHAPNKSVGKYVVWRMLMELMQYMSPAFRNLHIHYMTKLPGFDSAYEAKWKECADMVRSEFGPVAVKGLFDKGYLQREIISAIKADFMELKRSIALVFSTIEGVDEEVAKRFMDKLKGMKLETGYQEIVNQEGILDSFYGDIEINDNYFLNVMNMKRFKARKHLTRLWYGGNADHVGELSLEQNPLGSSTGYDYLTNTVRVDLGLFRPPIYMHSTEIPEYVTYAFSSILAREISRAFDATGSFYDADGKRFEKLWWPSSMEQRYDDALKCITGQIPILVNSNFAEINDTRTLNNFIADMGSFFIPYESMKEHLKSRQSEKPLPGIPLNKKQTFYVQIAQTFCELRNKPSSSSESMFLLSPKSRASGGGRVNGAVSNMEDFGSVFNCSVGSALNLQNKCSFFH